MNKWSSSLIIFLLLITGLFTSFQAAVVKTVKADEASVVWRFTWQLDYFEHHGWSGETQESRDVAYYINGIFPLVQHVT